MGANVRVTQENLPMRLIPASTNRYAQDSAGESAL